MLNKSKGWFAFFTLPLISIFTVVVLVPFVMGIWYSFFDWDGISANPMVFVGLENYTRIFRDQDFFTSIWLTIRFTAMAIITVNITGLGLALLVTSKLKSANLSRAMFFMPNLIGGLILGYIWQFIFSDAFRIIGENIGFEMFFRNWLLDRTYAMFALVIVFTWQMAGYMMVIYIAGIQGIPNETIEASKIDGANAWQRLKSVTLPLLMPSITIALFLTLSFSFKIYDVNLSLTDGGPVGSTQLVALHIYDEIFGYNNYGFGQAKAVIFFILLASVTLTQVYITKKREVEM